jgi:membrane-associated phospholipid phosphatase
MISWASILYGALLSGIAAALLVFAVRRDRRFDLLAAAALSGALGPFLWNAILHRVEGREFFVDAPIGVMPASWQDTGSGVFTLAVAAVILGLGPMQAEPGRRVVLLSLLCAVGAFLVDVYLY